MDDLVAADSEDVTPRERAIDDLHAFIRAARIVRLALERQVDPSKGKNDDGDRCPSGIQP